MKIKIGLTETQLERSVQLLSVQLSNEMVLYIKTRKFHWNVSGDSFMELHKLFQEQYTELEESIDWLAERINQLGGKTIGTMKEFLQATQLKEAPNKYPAAKEMLSELLNDREAIIVQLRKDVVMCAEKIVDAGTADLLTGLMEQHEKMAWIIRRYLD